jgi:ABC-type amino acid transport substrate-binding protein
MNFQEYCKYGYVDDVKRLLKYPRCNPPARNNKALRDAINYNKLQVVKLLFEDGRADFTVDDYTPIAYLAKKKQFKLVEEALNRYNLTYDIKNGIIIKYVIESKNIKYFNKIINEIKNVDCF